MIYTQKSYYLNAYYIESTIHVPYMWVMKKIFENENIDLELEN